MQPSSLCCKLQCVRMELQTELKWRINMMQFGMKYCGGGNWAQTWNFPLRVNIFCKRLRAQLYPIVPHPTSTHPADWASVLGALSITSCCNIWKPDSSSFFPLHKYKHGNPAQKSYHARIENVCLNMKRTFWWTTRQNRLSKYAKLWIWILKQWS